MGIFSRLMRRAQTTVRQPRRRPERCTFRPLLEQLELRLTPHSNAVMDAEHLAVFGSTNPATGIVTDGLAPDFAVTYKSIGNGNWSDPAIWEYLGSPATTQPQSGANVVITAGTTVTVDGTTEPVRTVRDDGVLRFDPTKDTTLKVDTLLVVGAFQMGTENEPIESDNKAKVVFVSQMSDVERRAWDPLQFSLGLVSHGEISIYGSTVKSFVDVPAGLARNATQINFGTLPEGWKVGDRLIITGNTATNSGGKNQDEEVAISAVSGTGVVTLSAALQFNHSAGSTYVANVTRNAVFQSDPANFTLEQSQYVGKVGMRGHVMFMHNHHVTADSAGFYGLGRTDKRTLIDDPVLVDDLDNPGHKTVDVMRKDLDPNHPEIGHRVLVPKVDANGNIVMDLNNEPVLEIARTGLNTRGRYAVHFHRTGIDPGHHGSTITGSAVVDSPGWGIVNHSSNVEVSENVVFNALGAAYVTETGEELGSFDHNIAIHSQGSGDGIESRKQAQDFGHQGDGFWLQGGNVSLTNNIAAGQRHSGYVFFPVGLNQKGLGVTTIAANALADPSWAGGKATVAVGDVPLREFKGNIAFGSGNAFESWFSLLNIRDGRRSIVEDFKAWGLSSGRGMFNPYTNQMTFKNVELWGNLKNPGGTAFSGNDVTRNMTYHVNIQGWDVGISAPVNGVNEVIGGTFNNLRNIYITTTNSMDRVVNIHDAGPDDPVRFLDNLTFTDKTGVHPRTQWDIYLKTTFNPMENDITTQFTSDIVRIGLVSINGERVYYREQAANFTPFPSVAHPNDANFGPAAAAFVPNDLKDKTNAELFRDYGLAIGGAVAPIGVEDGTSKRINGLIGPPPAVSLPDLRLVSAKYSKTSAYTLSYKYWDTATNKYITIREATPVTLVPGWNLLTRRIADATRTLLVYGDFTPPRFEFSIGTLRTVNKADIDNGATFVIKGTIIDDSTGRKNFEMAINLNDPKYVSEIKKDINGNDFVTLTFTIKDKAGNTTKVTVDLLVSYNAILTKDIGRKNLPTIAASDTLMALLKDL